MHISKQIVKQWYDKKEPYTQIRILRTIALQGYLSKTELADVLNAKITTLNATIQKLEFPKIEKDKQKKLIQRIGIEKITKGKRAQNMYTLTDWGIKVLLENHYRNDDDIAEERRSGDPYLTKHEFAKFVFMLFDKKSLVKQNISKKEVFNLYFKSNPSLESDFKQGKKIKNILKKKKNLIEIFEEDMSEIEDDLANAMFKSLENNFKKDDWKSRVGNLLKGNIDDASSINEVMEIVS